MDETTLVLEKNSAFPLYQQLYWQIRSLILSGKWHSGTKLPPSRTLAKSCQVARVTVTQAYNLLAAEGFVERRQGAGTFVADLPVLPPDGVATPTLTQWGRRVLSQPKDAHGRSQLRLEIDFGFGRSFSHIFPYDVWRRLLARYLSTDDVMLSRYGSVAGFLPLRRALADHLAQWRGVAATAAQIVIVSGAQQALDILSRLYLRSGDEVLVETPGYADAFELFRLHGARLRALPVGDHGFPVDDIPAHSRARFVFVTPSNQFPRGGAMPLAARLALLRWAAAHEALVIEDDYDGELRYDGRFLSALQSLDDGRRVVYLGTFSKVLFPALRLAYVVLPSPLMEPFIRAKGLVDRGAPTLTQAAVADFITEGHFDQHLRRLREAYGERRRVLEAALTTLLPERVHFVSEPAGLHVMLYLPPEMDETAVVRRAAAAGVGVYPGAPYHLMQPAPPTILLGFSGLSEAHVEEGVRRLAQVLVDS